MSDFRPAPRKKNALDNRKLHLSTPCPTAKGKWSSFQVNVFTADKTGEPNPRITVFTNDPEDSGEKNGYGKIQANLDPVVFYALMEKLSDIVNGPIGTEDKVKCENKNFTFPGGKRSEEPSVVSEIHFGKDADGSCWISVTARDRPRIKFPFGPNDFHSLFHRGGEQFSKGESSVLWARGWIRLMTQLIPQFLISDWKEVVREQQGGQGGGGGKWNNNRGSGGGGGDRGGYQKGNMSGGAAVDGADDDIPW
jgi:hypothetical protein